MKATANIIKTWPKLVQSTVKEYQARYHTRKVTLNVKFIDWKLYLAEGASYTVYSDLSKKAVSYDMWSNDTVGASGPAIVQMVNQYCPCFPAESWVIEFELFLGQAMINVYHVVADVEKVY